MRAGTPAEIVELADHVRGLGTLSAFLSGVVAGALMTLMTWFVEGTAESPVARIVMAWSAGFLIVLGGFNHAIVGSIELIFGGRYGVDVTWGGFFGALLVAIAGNLVGGLGLVTFTRVIQASASRS